MAAKEWVCSLSDPIMVRDWGKFERNRNLIKKSLWADLRKRPFAVYEFRYRSMGSYVHYLWARLHADVKTEGLIQEAVVSRTDNMSTSELRDYAVDLERSTHVSRVSSIFFTQCKSIPLVTPVWLFHCTSIGYFRISQEARPPIVTDGIVTGQRSEIRIEPQQTKEGSFPGNTRAGLKATPPRRGS